MRPQLHIAMLDEFGDAAFFQTKDAYRQTFEDYKRLRKQVVELQRNQQENKARIEMLEFQIAEIEQLPWKWMRTCVWSKNANACLITR